MVVDGALELWGFPRRSAETSQGAPEELAVGARVVLTGLKSAQYNGQPAVVVGELSEGRHEVRRCLRSRRRSSLGSCARWSAASRRCRCRCRAVMGSSRVLVLSCLLCVRWRGRLRQAGKPGRDGGGGGGRAAGAAPA